MMFLPAMVLHVEGTRRHSSVWLYNAGSLQSNVRSYARKHTNNHLPILTWLRETSFQKTFSSLRTKSTTWRITPCCLGQLHAVWADAILLPIEGEKLEIMSSMFNIINIELLSIKIQTFFPEK